MVHKYLKAAEIAKLLDVKPITARKWIAKGLFPNAVLKETIAGKIWLVPQNDVKAFKKPVMGRPSKIKIEFAK